MLAPSLKIVLQPVSLQDLPAEEQATAVQQRIVQEVRRPFDVARGPLVRFALFRLAEDEHVFVVSIHHIITDGWSMDIFYQELAALYDAFGRGEPSALPELPVQFVDYAFWQRQWLQGEVLERKLTYWKQHLKGAPALLELPTDRPRPPVQSDHGAHYPFLLPPALLQQLKALSQQENATLFMTLLAAFDVLLYRYSGQEDLVVGTVVANRSNESIEPLIGYLANTLALRMDLSCPLSFRELLSSIRAITLDAYTHQDVPFEQLVDALQLERNPGYMPLVQVALVLQNAQMFAMELGDLAISPLSFESGTSRFDLMLEVVEGETGLNGSLEYNTDLFDAATVARMMPHWKNILKSIVAAPDQQIARLPLQ